MEQVLSISPSKPVYNAVNIKINRPVAEISQKTDNSVKDGEYNAVNIEVNEPELFEDKVPVYDYPISDAIVTYDKADIAPIDIPSLPASYSIDSMAYINTKFDTKPESVDVPAPNLTTPENEKGDSFNGVSFQAAPKPKVKPASDIKPAVNMVEVSNNLTSADYDVQAKQMEEITAAALKDKEKSIVYVNTNVFSNLIDIAKNDTSSLQGPTEEQMEIRKKIILNEIIKHKAIDENKKPEEIELPYQVSQNDVKKAMELSPLEMAERNKEYALLTLAALAKVYGEEAEKQLGTVVPLTDMPGVSEMVETLKTSQNPSLRATALESLVYINRPEYKDEIAAILKIASEDKNPVVAGTAATGLEIIK